MKIGGMGEEALMVPLDQIRRLNELPSEVEIVRVLPPPTRGGRKYGSAWVRHDSPFPELFLHIRHRYCMRVSLGEALMYGSFEHFLSRYAQLKADEESKRGLKVKDVLPEGAFHPWVDDDV